LKYAKEVLMRWATSIIVLAAILTAIACQSEETELTRGDLAAISRALEDSNLKPLFEAWGDPHELLPRFREGQRRAEEEWRRNQAAITEPWDIGTTKTLEILPLVDWHTSAPSLKGDQGVSYLVRTDEVTVLFDLGRNMHQEDPSPLLYNMAELGVTLDGFGVIVITHNHSDHVGGDGPWRKDNTSFSLTNHQIDLDEKAVYTPVPMTYPGLTPVHSEGPTAIARGVATIGTISNPLFFLGYVQEQALAVNVEGKGIVIISGCGHQTLPKLLERADALFDEPVYGLLGGLHYTISDSRVESFGVPVLVYVGNGKVPWEPFTADEVQANIDLLKTYNLSMVAVSGHDSGDEALALFGDAFGDACSVIKVGEPIVISTGD
jgi:7,8-dihydropterin-6-yl-methyl-4-(beta-D-ribofuranosyl)aminobenzene 5'-phosphate synthase